MNTSNKSITFSFPFKKVSGVPVLFARLADYISKNFDYNVQVLDYKDGVMANMLKENTKIRLIEFKDGKATAISKNTTLVMQSILPNTMRNEIIIHPSTKILFWTLFHYNLIPDFLPIKRLRKIHLTSPFFKKIDFILKKRYYNNLSLFIEELHRKQSIFFMDYSTFEITSESLNLSISHPNIIPICIGDIKKTKNKDKKNETNIFNVCWIGRIEDFKTSILQYSLNQVKWYSEKSKKKIQFNVIGYGQDIEKVKASINKSKHFTINFIGEMGIDSLNDYLTGNIDLLMSMGTSALEGAKLGVPTVLLDASYDQIPNDYKFSWVFNSDGSNVAQFISSKSFQNNGMSIEKIIQSVEENSFRLGEDGFNYVKKNHSIKEVSKKVLEGIDMVSFTMKDISTFLIKKNIIRRFYDYYRYRI